MNKPEDFYNSQILKYQQHLGAASKKLAISSFLRLLVFLLLVWVVYYYFGNLRVLIPGLLAGIRIFLFLISRHTDLKYERDKFRQLIEINKNELKILNRDFSHTPTGREFEDQLHPFSQDVDLFGDSSFFQYLNRTSLKEGSKKLAALLLGNDIEAIDEKQEAIKELSEKADWRQNFSAIAVLVKTKTNSQVVMDWFRNYKSFVPAAMGWLPWIYSAISVAAISAFFFDLISGMALGIWLFTGLGITGIYLKKINKLSTHVSEVQDTFHQYYQLLGLIENTDFHSRILKAGNEKIHLKEQKVSTILRKFSKAIDSLDQRNNMIFGVLGNGFLLWDLRQSRKLEKWIAQYGDRVESWFEVIESLDAYNSLGNFSFNHPSFVYPVLDSTAHIMETKALAHPLLDPKKRVANDFSIENEQFFIITGANMAGKSTFLRTVSLHIIMANLGLPVCAESCSYTPIKLITSMRTTDSLSDDESYFFSELKRLKYIVEEIKTDNYFIILDEILKGTNSTDKAIGSRKFIEKLVASKSTGIIATHDLSLCEVADELPEVKNYYFDAEIINDELFFDYKFKTGICRNMNASFLLKKMQIVD